MCRNPDETTLIKLASSGDEKAMTQLFELMLPTVKAEAASFECTPSFTVYDLIQEGMLGLLRAVYSFSEDSSASFLTYSKVCIRNAMNSALRTQSRIKHRPLNSSVSLDEIPLQQASNELDPEAVVSMRENVSAIIRCIEEKLTEREKSVIKLHISGESYSSISEKLGISYKSVDNALLRARRKIREETKG